ncbi:MAG: hypothetical protein ACLPIC_18810 [Rhodoblastus sp.]
MGTMIERLRASKEVWWQENKAIGKQAGRAWAHDRAEYGELVAVARIDIGLDCYQYDELAAALGEGLGGEDVARALGVVRADLDKEPFMIGFIEAAKEVFEEVEHKL